MKQGLHRWVAQTVCQHEVPESPIMQEGCTQHIKAIHTVMHKILHQKKESSEAKYYISV